MTPAELYSRTYIPGPWGLDGGALARLIIWGATMYLVVAAAQRLERQ